MDALIASFLAMGDGAVPADWIEFVLDLYRQANIAVTAHATTHPELGTTLVTVLVYEGIFHVASVGDSRACLVRNGELRRITRDDSLVQDLLDSGAITPEESENHPLLNIITRSLGPGERMDRLAVASETLLPGDLLVLATDGFWKPAEHVIVGKITEFSGRPLKCLAEELVETAKRLESDDNISVALLRVAARRVDVEARKTQTYWTNKETENAETQCV
jgi:protein phosphatase